MTEKEILNLIARDQWMMGVLRTAEKLSLPDWAIGAGFVRNKVWDYLHGYKKEQSETRDIDLVYFDPAGNNSKADEQLSKKLELETGIEWDIVNQAYVHEWNKQDPYTSAEHALSHWPETATALGVRLEDKKLKLIAPYSIDDLVNLVVRPCPHFSGGVERVKERVAEKNWKEKWPKLKFIYE